MSAVAFCICEDGYVYRADTPGKLPKIIYRINSSLSRTTKDNTWYTAFVEDREWQRMPDNTLEWGGMKCQIETEDGFILREEAKLLGLLEDGIVLVAHISDKYGKLLTKKYPNTRHDGRAWVQLMAYMRDLAVFGTHDAVERYRPLRLV
jgi:hypothetical protein